MGQHKNENTAIVALRSIVGNLAEHEAEWERQELVAQLARTEAPKQRKARRFYGLPTQALSVSPAKATSRRAHAEARPACRYATPAEGMPIIPAPLVEPEPHSGARLLELYTARERRRSLRRRLLAMTVVLTLVLGGITATLAAIVLLPARPDGRLAGLVVGDPLVRTGFLAKRDLFVPSTLAFSVSHRRLREADAPVRKVAKRYRVRNRRGRILASPDRRRHRYHSKRRVPGTPRYRLYRPSDAIKLNDI